MIFFSVYKSVFFNWEDTSNTRECVSSISISNTLNFVKKKTNNSATWRIFNALFRVWKSDETLALVFDIIILLYKHPRKHTVYTGTKLSQSPGPNNPSTSGNILIAHKIIAPPPESLLRRLTKQQRAMGQDHKGKCCCASRRRNLTWKCKCKKTRELIVFRKQQSQKTWLVILLPSLLY